MDQPARGVREVGSPTAFLLKTYAIVDDPNSNPIISWSRSGTSFVVWDYIKMAAELLPIFFKHSNFSSFVYQLNNYGFRKIGLQQWEYENEWFQAGKKHLLGNIKRRNQIARAIVPRGKRKRSNINPTISSEMEAELERESTLLESSKLEILKLKQQLVDIEFRIAFSEEQMKNMESKSQKVIMFFARALGQTFVQDAIQHIGMEKESEIGEIVKKRKLLSAPESTENAAKSSEMPTLVSANDSPGLNPEEERDIPISTAENDLKICLDSFWMRLMGDDPCQNEAEREQARQQAMIDLELDEMIASKIEAEEDAKPTNLEAEEEVALQLWA